MYLTGPQISIINLYLLCLNNGWKILKYLTCNPDIALAKVNKQGDILISTYGVAWWSLHSLKKLCGASIQKWTRIQTPPPFKVSQLMQLSSHFVPQTSPPPVNSVLLQSQNKHLVRANCQAESCLRHKTATDMNIPLLRKPISWAAYSVGKKKKKKSGGHLWHQIAT